MKTLLLLLALTASSFAAPLTDVDKAYITPKNELSNPGAESLTAGWSASGGTFTTTGTAANVGSGKRAFSWDSNGAAQTLSSPVVQVNGKAGSNGAIAVRVKAASGVPTHKLQAYDGSVVLSEVSIVTSTSAYQRNVINFIFPSSGSVRLRLVSVAADEPLIYVDDGYLGLADGFNLGVLSQAYHYGSMSVTNCTGTTTWSTGGYNDQSSGGTACTYNATGKLSAPVGAYMGFSAAFEPGEYLITTGHSSSFSGGAASLGTRISNGTVHSKSPTKQLGSATAMSANSGDTYSLTVTSPLSASDFRFQVNISAGSYSSDTNGTNEFTFDVYKFPTLNQQAQTFDTVAQSWSGNVTGTTATTSAVLADLPGSPTLTEYSNTNMGTVSLSAASNGISLIPAKVGMIEVCANGTGYHSVANSTMGLAIYKNGALVDSAIGATQGVNGGSEPFSRCVYPKVTAAGSALEFKLQASINSGNFSVADVTWSFKYVDQGSPAPVIVGGVVTPSAGVEQLARATIETTCSSDPCVITRQSGGAFSVINWISTGVYRAHFSAGTFSDAPSCTFSSNGASGAISASPTSTTFDFITYNTTFAATDAANISIVCIGPK